MTARGLVAITAAFAAFSPSALLSLVLGAATSAGASLVRTASIRLSAAALSLANLALQYIERAGLVLTKGYLVTHRARTWVVNAAARAWNVTHRPRNWNVKNDR